MTRGSRARAVLVVLVLTLAGLTGCVQVPTGGPIEKVPGQAEACENCINVQVAPPAPGDDPGQVVEGFLQANSNYQPSYATARQFLTSAAAEAWRPEELVSIYVDRPPDVKGNTVRLETQLVGAVAEDRTFAAKDEAVAWDFGLVQESGEWRIDRPPTGLIVSKFAFDEFYRGYSTYFVGNTTSLVPDRIYLPGLRNPANIASALVSALLDGPSSWLAPAVSTAVPMGTTLSVDSVTITNGVAEVPLNDAVLALSDPQRALMAAQLAYTLRQVSGVKGVLITVDQQKFRVPGADPTSLVIAVDDVSRELDPVPYVSDRLYVARKDRVFLVADPNEPDSLQPVPGPLGEGKRFVVGSMTVSVNGTDLAVVTNKGTALRRVDTASGDIATLATGLRDLLRPQFTRYGEVWALGRQDGQQRLWRSNNRTELVPVEAPSLAGRDITAFRISPDGTRIAFVRRVAGGSELGLAKIVRANEIAVKGWRRIDVTQSQSTQLDRIADVAWLDANELLVLGRSGEGAAPVAVRVAADASQVIAEGGEPTDWNASSLTVLSRPQTVIAIDSTGKSWRRTGGQWVPYLSETRTVAYAG